MYMWININEKHPEFHVPVLVCGEGRIAIARLITIIIHKDTTKFDFVENDLGMEDLYIAVSHWMPIPEAPKQ